MKRTIKTTFSEYFAYFTVKRLLNYMFMRCAHTYIRSLKHGGKVLGEIKTNARGKMKIQGDLLAGVADEEVPVPGGEDVADRPLCHTQRPS